mmetsp:Transcript_28135/g.63657  ORF Transcript_28135/g.63657 Transcript_28135/m.63657 type:complete len:168 (+) Transcript_28135:909-1412(+)
MGLCLVMLNHMTGLADQIASNKPKRPSFSILFRKTRFARSHSINIKHHLVANIQLHSKSEPAKMVDTQKMWNRSMKFPQTKQNPSAMLIMPLSTQQFLLPCQLYRFRSQEVPRWTLLQLVVQPAQPSPTVHEELHPADQLQAQQAPSELHFPTRPLDPQVPCFPDFR